MDKELFEIMIENWLVDHDYEMSELDIGEPYQDEYGDWIADAEDEKYCYELRDSGDGNILFNYSSTK